MGLGASSESSESRINRARAWQKASSKHDNTLEVRFVAGMLQVWPGLDTRFGELLPQLVVGVHALHVRAPVCDLLLTQQGTVTC